MSHESTGKASCWVLFRAQARLMPPSSTFSHNRRLQSEHVAHMLLTVMGDLEALEGAAAARAEAAGPSGGFGGTGPGGMSARGLMAAAQALTRVMDGLQDLDR